MSFSNSEWNLANIETFGRPYLSEATIIMESDDDTEELLLLKSGFIKTEEETRPSAG